MKTDLLDARGRKPSARITERRVTERVRNKWARIAKGRLPSLKEIEAIIASRGYRLVGPKAR